MGAAVAAAALLSRRATEELADRDRVIRIARREGATLRSLADRQHLRCAAVNGNLAVTGDPEADHLLNTDPLALLVGMMLDQQVR